MMNKNTCSWLYLKIIKKFLSTSSFVNLNHHHEHIAPHRGFQKSDNMHHQHADHSPVVGMCLTKRLDPQKNVAQKGPIQKNCVINTDIKLNASNTQ